MRRLFIALLKTLPIILMVAFISQVVMPNPWFWFAEGLLVLITFLFHFLNSKGK